MRTGTVAPGGRAMRVLVCGGAGYVGSHMVRRLAQSGHEVVVLDNLSTGHREAVGDVALVVADLRDAAALDRVFAAQPFDAVMHFCASSLVGESMREPLAYWDNNVGGSLALLGAMRRAGVRKLVFSSTAAVYGQPEVDLIDEAQPKRPINPYGWTKLAVEQVLQQLAQSEGFESASLRYFNAAGASEDGWLGESHDPETHLIPNLLFAALGRGEGMKIFGDDYPTPDGTCIRDYVHVLDLAEAHLAALETMDGGTGARAFNLGLGSGYSVMQVLQCVRRVTGIDVPVQVVGRRPGDPPVLVASNRLALTELGWRPVRSGIEDIVASAWRWHRAQRF